MEVIHKATVYLHQNKVSKSNNASHLGAVLISKECIVLWNYTISNNFWLLIKTVYVQPKALLGNRLVIKAHVSHSQNNPSG